MPLFHRSTPSAEKKSRSHRFSFRRHSHEPSEVAKAPAPPAVAAAPRAPPPSAAATASPAARQVSTSLPPSTTHLSRAPPVKGGSSITSEAATSVASSSLRSSTSLSFVDRSSGGGGGAATAAETSSSSESESEGGDSVRRPPAHPSLATRSLSSSSSVASSQSGKARSSLADYRQLRWSMSYKNRVLANDAHRSAGDSNSTGRASDLRMTDLRWTEMSARISESGRSSSRGSESRDRESSEGLAEATSQAAATTEPVVPVVPVTAPNEPEVRMTEVNIAAMQTRRALQQMVLSLEDEDSENDDESESEGVVRSNSSASDAGVLRVSADDYRRFQFRLRQLEEMCHEQARKQATIEDTIEREVRTRTRKVVDAMERNMAMYRQAKDAELERRVSEMDANGVRASVRSSFRESTSAGSARLSTRESEKGKPLEKLFHPRRARRRLELMREREEQQKREMEHFREFIRSTEASVAFSHVHNTGAAAAALHELGDPLLAPDALLNAPPQELVDVIVVLRKHVSVQEAQLSEAKSLISAAIEARDEAEETAREAVDLTLALDSRLERASQELRASQLYARSLSPPRDASALLRGSSLARKYSDATMPSTPSSPSYLD